MQEVPAEDYSLFEEELLANLKRRLQAAEPHQKDYEFFRYSTGQSGLFLDIGANFGISVASFRLYNRTAAVMSFEPLPWMENCLRYLKELEGETFDYRMVAIGDADGEIDIGIPTVDGTPNFFRASAIVRKFSNPSTRDNLRRSLSISGPIAVRKIRVPLMRLDPMALAPTIIKIDVEGLELRVLEGAWQTITNWRPVIFLELSADKQHILERMSSVNYCCFSYEDHRIRKYEWNRHTDNVIFLPGERIEEIRTALASNVS